jgi:hypothetical protein
MKNWTFTLFFTCLSGLLWAQDITVPRTQNSLVTKMTATWCSICGSTAWDNYKSLVGSLNTKALVMAGHSSTSSSLYSPTAEKLIQNFEQSLSHPTFFYNTTRIGSSGTTMVNNITNNVNNANKTAPQAQAGLIARLDPGTRELVVQSRIEFFQPQQGEYYYAIYLLEKTVTAPQAARPSNETHQNVMRTALHANPFGDLLSSGNTAEGTIKGVITTFPLPAGYNPANLIIAGIIWKKNGTKFDFVNLNYTGQVSVSVTSTMDARLLQGFKVFPNPISNSALVTLNLPAPAGNTDLELFDVFGRKIHTVFQGRLQEGQHQFYLDRSAFKAPPGYYLLRLRHGAAQATQQLLFH